MRYMITIENGVTTVTDSYGERWYYDFNSAHIKCLGDDTYQGGYPCNSLDDGIRLLIEYGYINDEEE